MTPLLAISSGTVAVIVVIVVIDLFAIVFGLSFARSRRAQRQADAAAGAAILGEPAPPAPKPVSRREFFRRSLVVSLLVFGAEFGGATIAFLWPNLRGGFGSLINVGKLDDILAYIEDNDVPFYSGTGRFYIVKYNGKPEGDVDYATEGVTAQGIMPLYQRCVHLGCRVPFCQQSQWFECPCHGSKYNTAGEYKLGPAPHGMDRFKVDGHRHRRRPGRHRRDHPGPTPGDRHDPQASGGPVLRGGAVMLGLSQAQGVILAVGGAIFLAIAGGVLVLRGRQRREADIPNAMRPGPSDPDLETPLLQKLQGWGVVTVLFFVIWVPAVWLLEPEQNLDQEQDLISDAIDRGEHAVELYSEDNQAGVGCVQCHGPTLQGSLIPNTLTPDDPYDVQPTPDLTTVCGGPFTGHPLIYGLDDIYTTIEQGRGLMPSWSIRFEGALGDQQINDIVNYIVSIQDKDEVKFSENVCTNPEALTKAIDEFLDGDPTNKPNPTTNIEF